MVQPLPNRDALGAEATLHFDIPGWEEIQEGRDMALWRDVYGNFLGLVRTLGPLPLPPLGDREAVRRHCRLIAQDMGSGLIEAEVVESVDGSAVRFICKHLHMPELEFTGVLMVPRPSASWVWSVTEKARDGTGAREAAVAHHLIEEGKLTLENYRTVWAQDPYDPSYHEVDSISLRYLSDDERYDEQFPNHPLSRVRQELRKLLGLRLLT